VVYSRHTLGGTYPGWCIASISWCIYPGGIAWVLLSLPGWYSLGTPLIPQGVYAHHAIPGVYAHHAIPRGVHAHHGAYLRVYMPTMVHTSGCTSVGVYLSGVYLSRCVPLGCIPLLVYLSGCIPLLVYLSGCVPPSLGERET